MTQVHFTLNQEDIQKLIEESVTDDLSKNLLTTVVNQPMEEQPYQIYKLCGKTIHKRAPFLFVC